MRMRPERMPFVWHEDKQDNVWKYGAQKDGMGVFIEPDGKWHGNIVVPGSIDVLGVGPYGTMLEAMRECEIMYLRLQAQLTQE